MLVTTTVQSVNTILQKYEWNFVFCNHSCIYRGEVLPTNGLVNISQLGNSTDNGLVCSTDQSEDGTPEGGWFNPDGTVLSTRS